MKRGPKGDPNPQKGPLGDPGPLKGTHCGTVVIEPFPNRNGTPPLTDGPLPKS